MKNTNDTERLPEGMADIKSGEIFEVPAGYFEELTDRLFDEEGHLKEQSGDRNFRIRTIRPWLVAASVALLVMVSWWLTTNPYQVKNEQVSDAQLEEYIHSEIMEYDLKTLSRNINEVDLYSLSGQESEDYESYFEEHLDDFDDIITQ